MTGQTVRETVLYFRTWNPAGGYDIRVWTKPAHSGPYSKLKLFVDGLPSVYTKRDLADAIAARFPDFVNAVEVKDSNSAELTYNDWP